MYPAPKIEYELDVEKTPASSHLKYLDGVLPQTSWADLLHFMPRRFVLLPFLVTVVCFHFCVQSKRNAEQHQQPDKKALFQHTENGEAYNFSLMDIYTKATLCFRSTVF